MEKFVLVNVPSYENAYHNMSDFVSINQPVGLLTIGAALESMDCQVKVIDGDAEGLSLAETIELTLQEDPDWVGATTMTAVMDIIGKFFTILKEKAPAVKTILGGPHVSAIPGQTLEELKAIDICVIGEGDETIIELINALRNNRPFADVAGLCLRENDKIIMTRSRPQVKDLSKTFSPAFHLINFNNYRSYGWNNWVSGYRQPAGVVFTSRGCIGKCNFCASHCVFGRGIRFFTMERIISEIDILVNKYNIRILDFLDDTFTVNRKLVNAICDYLIEKKYNERLEIQISARVDTVHFPTLQKMRKAGIRWICFGVESGNQKILDRMKKNITIDQIRKAFKLANQAGLYVSGNFMIGHIGETWDTAMDTINLACELEQMYASFAIAIPFPGTELYQYCMDTGINIPAWNDFGSVNTPPIPINQQLDINTLMELRNIAVNRFFKNPTFLVRLLWKFNTIAVIKDFAKMYFALRAEKKANRF